MGTLLRESGPVLNHSVPRFETDFNLLYEPEGFPSSDIRNPKFYDGQGQQHMNIEKKVAAVTRRQERSGLWGVLFSLRRLPCCPRNRPEKWGRKYPPPSPHPLHDACYVSPEDQENGTWSFPGVTSVPHKVSIQ